MKDMERRGVRAEVPGGELVGWVEGSGPPVLLLHGGPGLSYGYLDDLGAELLPRYTVAAFQQRGLAPSTVEGPFTVERAVADVGAFLDALGWERAYVVGHSWGGHLLLHLTVALPGRLMGGLAVDPLGAVGDGGMATMSGEMAARTPAPAAPRLAALEQKMQKEGWTDDDFLESVILIWPAYFADQAAVPAPPEDLRASFASYGGLFASLSSEMGGLAAALPAVTVPMGFVAGAASPLPAQEASVDSAAVILGAFAEVVEGAGHMIWYEAPGRVGAALDRLVREAPA
jgi:pimeloyl-ACP methyl ester carboxylesterase